MASASYTKDFNVQASIISWNGLDSSGVAEQSFPVTFKLCDATTNAVATSITATGAVTNLAMPPFKVTVPNNTTVKVKYYVTVTDSATPTPNVSAKSPNSNEVTLVGDDTNPPAGVNTVNITITP